MMGDVLAKAEEVSHQKEEIGGLQQREAEVTVDPWKRGQWSE